MTRDVTKLNFYSGDPIDKIVWSDTVTYTNDGNTTTTGTNDGDQAAKIQLDTIPNPYGKKVFARFVWSIDGTNFNAADAHIDYSFTITLTDIPVTSTPLQALKAGVAIGVSASTITFQTANGFHGNSSRTSAASTSTGYTPTSLTFTIKYALFEVS